MTIKMGTSENPCVIVLDTKDVSDGLHMMFSPDSYDFFWTTNDGPVTLKRLKWTDDASYIEHEYGTGPADDWDDEDEKREAAKELYEPYAVDPAEYRGNDYGDDEPDDDDLPF